METVQNQIITGIPVHQVSQKSFMSISQLESFTGAQLLHWVDHGDSLQEEAKNIIRQRLGRVDKITATILQTEYNNIARPAWYKELVLEETKRRQAFLEKQQVKKEERESYIKGKPKKKTAAYYKLLDAHWQHSIFKIKWQFKEPNQHGDYWLSKKYSRDYGDERQKIAGIGDQLLRKMLREKGEFGYELFYKGGLKDAGFNGFMYSMKTFNSLRESDKIGFFAVYLNNVLEQHVNEEFYSMEIWRWGELRGG